MNDSSSKAVAPLGVLLPMLSFFLTLTLVTTLFSLRAESTGIPKAQASDATRIA